ncbi:hypothetical protein [Brevundimonas sp. EYE_349]|uniref:hypothetical protein n=1 Tax=Brevundimonas sp. EYE_349 TaxID=2853455 RepID=UPI0020046C02|nr:hypothetical protein [Brevundimonas sp. EYE_349]MCK6104243.1 hypothetical protein [Brevundimonas sp. EYE_349]
MLYKVMEQISSAPVRLSAAFATLLALAVLLAPGAGWTFEWDRASAFVVAFTLWAVSEGRALVARHPHDLRLMALIENTLSQKERANLRSMEMSEDFQWSDFSGLREVAVWEGPDYRFLDKTLEKAWAPVLEALQSFRTELARRSMPKAGDGGWYSVRAEARREQWETDAAFLNDASDKLTQQLDAFLVLGRRRLGA